MNMKILSFLICMLMIVPVIAASGAIEKNLNVVKKTNSTFLSVNDNNPPNPPKIEGPLSGKIGKTYVYNITLTDPDEDDQMFFLEVDFGEGIEHEDCGCGKSWQNGTILEVSHRWKKVGDYGITARVQDGCGEWSEWSDPLFVSMPKHKELPILFIFLSGNFLKHFPSLEKLTDIITSLELIKSGCE